MPPGEILRVRRVPCRQGWKRKSSDSGHARLPISVYVLFESHDVDDALYDAAAVGSGRRNRDTDARVSHIHHRVLRPHGHHQEGMDSSVYARIETTQPAGYVGTAVGNTVGGAGRRGSRSDL